VTPVPRLPAGLVLVVVVTVTRLRHATPRTPTVREAILAGQARTTLRFWIIFDRAVVLGRSHVARARAPAMGDAERGDWVRVVTRPLVPIFTPDWSEGDQT